jgi:alpha-methylacyl-CoA racemase
MLPGMTNTRNRVELGGGTGPLRGVKVVEIAGIGPGPHACMILADLGADVIRVERPGGQLLSGGATMVLNRGRPSVALDLKQPEAVAVVLELVGGADVLVEGMRPGVAERLGIGPEQCHAVNPRLVYGRMTGWGQDGPLARAAGHDINYISVAGALYGMGQTPDRPQFPANLVGDFGGGSTYLVIGLLAALLEARLSGQGQVVDAAIVDGTAHLNAMTSAFLAGGGYHEQRGANLLDGGVPYYDVYETSDGRHVSVGALEPQFYATLVATLGLEGVAPGQAEPDRYDELRTLLTDTFRQRTQAEWVELFEGTDACVAGVIPVSEAAGHPHLEARRTFVEHEGLVQPQPAPRFSRTEASLGLPPAPAAGTHTRDALVAWGVPDVDGLIERGIAVQA